MIRGVKGQRNKDERGEKGVVRGVVASQQELRAVTL